MSLNERLFAKVHRKWRRWRSGDAAANSTSSPPLELDDVRLELHHLAAMFAAGTGTPGVEVRAAERDGRWIGPTLLLPARLALGLDRDGHAAGYAWRTGYAWTSRRLGFVRPDGVRDGADETLAALLAVPKTRADFERDWPGAAELWSQLAPALRDARRDQPTSAGLATLEALYDLRLARPLAEVKAELQGSAAARWLEDAIAARVDSPDDLQRAFDRLAAAMPRAKGRVARRAAKVGVDLPLFGKLWSPSGDAAGGDAQARTNQADAGRDNLTPRTEHRGRTRENVELLEIEQNPESQNPLNHVFEKLLTAEEYQGGRKSLDGSDELDEHAEALDELELRHVIRTRERTDSLYRSDTLIDSGSDLDGDDHADVATPSAIYDEWHEARREYRTDWCRVYDRVAESRLPPERVAAYVRNVRQRFSREIRALRASFDRVEQQRALRPRQRDGSDIDLDAVVDYTANLRAARSRDRQSFASPIGGDRLYVSRRQHSRELAVMVLLDASLSTDAWIDGHRVLDVARDSVLVLGEVLGDRAEPGLQIAVSAFWSDTRRACAFRRVKAFDEPWSRAHGRLLSLRPTGYTRIGAAIRHATTALAHVKSKHKLLLLLSDGKPTDYDRYEGDYGIGDVRQALREAHREHVRALALTVEKQGKLYLPRMFGPRGYRILPTPRALPSALAEIHRNAL